jgi:hypothetical protein
LLGNDIQKPSLPDAVSQRDRIVCLFPCIVRPHALVDSVAEYRIEERHYLTVAFFRFLRGIHGIVLACAVIVVFHLPYMLGNKKKGVEGLGFFHVFK